MFTQIRKQIEAETKRQLATRPSIRFLCNILRIQDDEGPRVHGCRSTDLSCESTCLTTRPLNTCSSHTIQAGQCTKYKSKNKSQCEQEVILQLALGTTSSCSTKAPRERTSQEPDDD